MVFQMVQNNLWSVYPPEPASEEEQALEDRQKEALQLKKAQEKVLPACPHISSHTIKPTVCKHSLCQCFPLVKPP